MKKRIKLGEMKTGRVAWTQRRVDKDDQLTFYAYVIYLKYKKLPDEILLEWMPTDFDSEGLLQLTGRIHTFSTQRTMRDILVFYPRIVAAWEGIRKIAKELGKPRSRSYLSHSQMRTFEQSPDEYRRMYFEKGERYENGAIKFGKYFHEVLEGKHEPKNKVEEYVKTFLSQYKQMEYEIRVKSPACLLLARLDGFLRI